MLLIGLACLGTVCYDIYQHPSDPNPDGRGAGTATIRITGTGRFTGEVGTVGAMHAVEGTAPFEFEVAYGRSDYVSVYARLEGPGTAEIRVGCRTVAEGTGHSLVWKPPRSWEDGLPPEGWSRCKGLLG